MNEPRPPLDRLLERAARAPAAVVPAEPPFGFDARVLAAWRAARAGSDWAPLLALFRRGAVVAAAVALCAALFSFRDLDRVESDEFTLAYAAVNYAVNP